MKQYRSKAVVDAVEAEVLMDKKKASEWPNWFKAANDRNLIVHSEGHLRFRTCQGLKIAHKWDMVVGNYICSIAVMSKEKFETLYEVIS